MRKIVLLYITDRDGMPVAGEQVDWAFDSAAGLIDKVLTPAGWKVLGGQVRETSTHTFLPKDQKIIGEYFKPEVGPTSGELFNGVVLDEAAFYDNFRHGVTGVVIYRSEPTAVDIRISLHEREGVIAKDIYLNFAYVSPADPEVELKAGGWNQVIFEAPNATIENGLASILAQDVDVTVWSSDGKGYSSTAPAWACDLKGFTWKATYWIQVSKDVTWIYGNP